MALTDRIFLDVANRRRLGVDLTKSVVSAERSGSVEQAPNIVLTVRDGARLLGSDALIRPAVRQIGSPGWALRPVDLLVDGVWWRLAQGSLQVDGTALMTFEHRGVAYMREHDWPISASRTKTTRALFIRRQVDEVGRRKGVSARLDFWAPEVRRRMPTAPGDDAKLSARAEQGRDPSATVGLAKKAKGLTVQGKRADVEQRKNMAIAMEVADTMQAGPRATLALVVAAIGESGFRAIPNAAGSGYAGVWQADPKNIPMSETRKQATYFLKGGLGFQAGGAINAAREHPDWSPGTIATKVEASGEDGSFYDAYRREADAIIDVLGGSAPSTGQGGSYVKAYIFRRNKGQNAWDSTDDLARVVNRRRFVTFPARGMDLFVYAADRDLIGLPAQATISIDDPAVSDFTYDLDWGKTARTASLKVRLDDPTSIAWGLPIQLNDAEGATGRWLVWAVRETDGSPDVELDLRQGQPSKLEPASSLVARSDVNDSPADASRTRSASAYSAAFAIDGRNYPYVWGGGHGHAGRPDRGTGRDPGIGFDCSGFVAACLAAGDMLPQAWRTNVPGSGTFASEWGQPGEGKDMTVWANSEHVFIEFHLKGKKGHYADTSRQAGGPSGSHLRYGKRSTAGFTPRHWPGSDETPDTASAPHFKTYTGPAVSKRRSGKP